MPVTERINLHFHTLEPELCDEWFIVSIGLSETENNLSVSYSHLGLHQCSELAVLIQKWLYGNVTRKYILGHGEVHFESFEDAMLFYLRFQGGLDFKGTIAIGEPGLPGPTGATGPSGMFTSDEFRRELDKFSHTVTMVAYANSPDGKTDFTTYREYDKTYSYIGIAYKFMTLGNFASSCSHDQYTWLKIDS